MELGVFLMPTVSPETTLSEATQFTLDAIRYAEELNYSEAWIGEHYTAVREPIPSPDIVIAQALKETSKIKLAAGAHLLPYHHPVELAIRVAYLDHLAQGRLMLGVAPGAVPTDATLFGMKHKDQNREMTAEALEIMFKMWTEEDFEYEGKYWSAKIPKEMINGGLKHHIKPFQKPYPPIGVAGSNPNSSTLKLAGEYGFLPMSLGVNENTAANHWDTVVEGAKKTNKNPQREDWRIVYQIFVADTDEEALDYAINGAMGKAWGEYFLEMYSKAGLLDKFKHSPEVRDEEVTVEYLAKNIWFVGSPQTVARKLDSLYKKSGGFGVLLLTVYDYEENRDAWNKSMKLLKEEVIPNLKKPVMS